MIKIQKAREQRLYVYLPYDLELIRKIRSFDSLLWVQQKKCWSVPHTDESIKKLADLFKDEEFEVEPPLDFGNLFKR
jgi:hypothetical protein